MYIVCGKCKKREEESSTKGICVKCFLCPECKKQSHESFLIPGMCRECAQGKNSSSKKKKKKKKKKRKEKDKETIPVKKDGVVIGFWDSVEEKIVLYEEEEEEPPAGEKPRAELVVNCPLCGEKQKAESVYRPGICIDCSLTLDSLFPYDEKGIDFLIESGEEEE